LAPSRDKRAFLSSASRDAGYSDPDRQSYRRGGGEVGCTLVTLVRGPARRREILLDLEAIRGKIKSGTARRRGTYKFVDLKHLQGSASGWLWPCMCSEARRLPWLLRRRRPPVVSEVTAAMGINKQAYQHACMHDRLAEISSNPPSD